MGSQIGSGLSYQDPMCGPLLHIAAATGPYSGYHLLWNEVSEPPPEVVRQLQAATQCSGGATVH